MISGNLDKKASKVHSPPAEKDQALKNKRGLSPDVENDPPKQQKLDIFEPPSHRHESTPTSSKSFTKIKSPEKGSVTTPTQTIIDDEETSPKSKSVKSTLSR